MGRIQETLQWVAPVPLALLVACAPAPEVSPTSAALSKPTEAPTATIQASATIVRTIEAARQTLTATPQRLPTPTGTPIFVATEPRHTPTASPIPTPTDTVEKVCIWNIGSSTVQYQQNEKTLVTDIFPSRNYEVDFDAFPNAKAKDVIKKLDDGEAVPSCEPDLITVYLGNDAFDVKQTVDEMLQDSDTIIKKTMEIGRQKNSKKDKIIKFLYNLPYRTPEYTDQLIVRLKEFKVRFTKEIVVRYQNLFVNDSDTMIDAECPKDRNACFEDIYDQKEQKWRKGIHVISSVIKRLLLKIKEIADISVQNHSVPSVTPVLPQ